MYKAKHLESEEILALKFERKNDKNRLKKESELLKKLNTLNIYGFPKFFDYCTTKDFSFLAMEILGPNLEDLLEI